jgi:WD40 repeat protein
MVRSLLNLLLIVALGCLLTPVGSWCFYGKFKHSNDVYQVSFSPDGSKVVVASKDNNHFIYNA